MNNFLSAIRILDLEKVKALLQEKPGWLRWSAEDGKNALHFLCGVPVFRQTGKARQVLQLVKLFLKNGMDINAIHRIPGSCDDFPATPLWYAYTRGRNGLVVRYLLAQGADPEHCMFAIAWYDDVSSAKIFRKYGATIEDDKSTNTPFLAAINWKKFRMAKWLLEQGADVNAADGKGDTALHYAIRRKYPVEVFNLLLKFHADQNKKNQEGVSARNLAILKKQRKIIPLLDATPI